jgi:hypothetical protein
VLPRSNLNDLNVDPAALATVQSLLTTTSDTGIATPHVKDPASQSQQSNASSISLKTRDKLGVDDQGKYDYHSHFAGFMFLQQMWEQYGQALRCRLEKKNLALPLTVTHVFSLSLSSTELPPGIASRDSETLPSRATAVYLAGVCLENACCTFKFIHAPSFNRMLGRLYDVDPRVHSDVDRKSLALVYAVLAIGVLFSKEDAGNFDSSRIRIEGYATLQIAPNTTYVVKIQIFSCKSTIDRHSRL